MSESVRSHFSQETGTGGGVPKLALFRIEEAPLLVPTIVEQQEIASAITSIEILIDDYQKKFNQINLLKYSSNFSLILL